MTNFDLQTSYGGPNFSQLLRPLEAFKQNRQFYLIAIVILIPGGQQVQAHVIVTHDQEEDCQELMTVE